MFDFSSMFVCPSRISQLCLVFLHSFLIICVWKYLMVLSSQFVFCFCFCFLLLKYASTAQFILCSFSGYQNTRYCLVPWKSSCSSMTGQLSKVILKLGMVDLLCHLLGEGIDCIGLQDQSQMLSAKVNKFPRVSQQYLCIPPSQLHEMHGGPVHSSL